MPKIIFEINYNIIPEKREGYLETMNSLKSKIRESGLEYSVYENRKNPDNFSEIYTCNSEDEFDSLEDNQSDETMELTQRLFDEYIKDKKVTYSTKYEI